VERRNNFDLLRLVAAVSVIFSDAFLLSENSQDHDPLAVLTGGLAILGIAGVFVFFTISGYLVTQSFDTTASPLVFLAKRALRIFYPAGTKRCAGAARRRERNGFRTNSASATTMKFISAVTTKTRARFRSPI
jgi:hypothetical protein